MSPDEDVATTPSHAARAPRRRRAQRGSGERLRADIVAATKKLLAEAADADAVSIRAVADAVGVTSPSIYLHFADKEALLDAVVADVFAELDAAMLAAAESLANPLARLRAFGLAYVGFAVQHPEHYRLATMEAYPAERPVDVVLASSAFTHFQNTVVDCMQAGIFAEGDPLPITLDLWAVAHGIAALIIAKPHLPWGDVTEAADRALCSAAIGHAVSDLMPGTAPEDVDAVTTWLAEQRRRPAQR